MVNNFKAEKSKVQTNEANEKSKEDIEKLNKLIEDLTNSQGENNQHGGNDEEEINDGVNRVTKKVLWNNQELIPRKRYMIGLYSGQQYGCFDKVIIRPTDY